MIYNTGEVSDANATSLSRKTKTTIESRKQYANNTRMKTTSRNFCFRFDFVFNTLNLLSDAGLTTQYL